MKYGKKNMVIKIEYFTIEYIVDNKKKISLYNIQNL